MTRLPAAQQGLVLYQNLAGKAWVAAEELSVDKLSADSGVQYLVKWISGRYLDLEITRIGKAFSEFFRRLRRRPGQSIREYNAEYDRLHARLREGSSSTLRFLLMSKPPYAGFTKIWDTLERRTC